MSRKARCLSDLGMSSTLPCCRSAWAISFLAKPGRHPGPEIQQLPEHPGALKILLDELIEADAAFDPAHLEGREPLAADPNSLVQEGKIDHEREPGLLQVLRDVPVAVFLPGQLCG